MGASDTVHMPPAQLLAVSDLAPTFVAPTASTLGVDVAKERELDVDGEESEASTRTSRSRRQARRLELRWTRRPVLHVHARGS